MELHVLIDFENVQPTFEDVNKLAPGFTDVWLFHGPRQVTIAQLWASTHQQITLVPISRFGKNALDFHLTFYLGYVAAKHPNAHLVVVANDKGYDPMIEHARMLKFTVKRVSYKVKAMSKKAAPLVAKKSASIVKVKPLQRSMTSKKTPTPAKKADTRKLPAKKVPAKKSPVKKSVNPKIPTQLQSSVPAERKELLRIQKGLANMGDKAPHKFKSFQRHIGALLGKDSTTTQIDAVIHALEEAGTVHIAGDLVLYKVKKL
jgi:PIN domain